MATIDEQADAYQSSRRRIVAFARDLDVVQLATTVTCCPQWTAKDLLGHLTGVLEDRGAGRLPSGGFEEWTATQVARHRDEAVVEILDRWESLSVERDDSRPSLAALSFDVVTHEHDLFQALGVDADRASESVLVGVQRAKERMSSMLAESSPGVIVTTEDGTETIGGALPPIGLRTSRFLLMRLVTGRMSRRQAESLAWTGNPAPVIDALGADAFFTLQPNDVDAIAI